ncbi:MAG: SRPBCC family protein [Vicinamibacterales bacterium]
MKVFRSAVRIAASPERIWATLVDSAKWPELDSSLSRVDGTPCPGGKVTVHSKQGRPFPLNVAEFVPSQRLVLTGGMPLGLFTGRRTYTLAPQSDGAVQFTMHEEFSGPLAPLVSRAIPDLQPAFDEFASNLKKRAEAI